VRAIFVMDENGEFYSSFRHDPTKFYHSSFLAGGPVAGSGEWVVVNGVLQYIDNDSGHYVPKEDLHSQVLKRLEKDKIVPIDQKIIHEHAWDFDSVVKRKQSGPKLCREALILTPVF